MSRKLVFILLLLPFFINAQVVSDARLWSGITVSKKINDFKFSISEELRFDENITHIDKVFTELGVEYKVVKGLFLTLNYRFNRDNDYETKNYDLKHRVDFGITYKYKLDKFRFAIRSKIQTRSALPNENNPTFSRNKLTIKYALKNKFTPFVSYEFYYQFNDQKVINRNRFSLGSKYAINDKSGIKFFYLYENKFNVKNLKHNHIYGISYSIDI